jgi:hypothetical protein
MSMNSRWKVLVACAAFALAATACGEDDKGTKDDENPAGGSDGGANGSSNGDATAGNGADGSANDGDGGGWTPPPPLEPGVAGKACTEDEDCGAGGTCADSLRGGSYAGETLGSGAAPGGYCTRSCTENADCGDGICFGTVSGRRGGECRKACGTDGDCNRPEYECAKLNRTLADNSGANVDVPTSCQAKRTIATLTTEVANACTNASMCGTNGRCLGGGGQGGGGDYPGGYCSGYCDTNADCGAEGTCYLRTYGHGGSCYETCSVDTDCKRDNMNYGCIDLEDSAGTKVCLGEMDPLNEGVVGNACTDDTMCGNADCATRVGTMQVLTPGGYCSITGCSEDVDCSSTGVCAITGTGSRCYKKCAADADCRVGYTCAVYGDNMKNVCFPIATTGDAGTGP